MINTDKEEEEEKEEDDDKLHCWPPKASISKTGLRSTGACTVCLSAVDT